MAKFAHNDVKLSASDKDITVHTFTDTASGAPKEKVFCRHCAVTIWTIPESIKGSFLLVRTPVLNEGSVKVHCLIFNQSTSG